MTIAAVTEGLAFILRAVKSALSRRAAVDLKAGEKLVEATEASTAEIDKLADGVAP
jgi:hypothetical protein